MCLSDLLGWETLWPEVENWNMLIKQYEDCVIINTALCLAAIDKAALHMTAVSDRHEIILSKLSF